MLGGTHQENDWNTSINPADSKFIWDGCVKLAPMLKVNCHLSLLVSLLFLQNAKVIKQQVGLRPGRPTIRLECEKMKVCGKEIPVVHNYGHGGSGLTLHRGCASDAAALAKSALNKHSVDHLAKL